MQEDKREEEDGETRKEARLPQEGKDTMGARRRTVWREKRAEGRRGARIRGQ